MYVEGLVVEGFKNFSRRVEVNGLRPFTVIHGPNGVGKTNLIEALSLLFRLVEEVAAGRAEIRVARPLPTHPEAFRLGTAGEWFNRDRAIPVHIAAQVVVTDLEGGAVLPGGGTVGVTVTITRGASGPIWEVDLGQTSPRSGGHVPAPRAVAELLTRRALLSPSEFLPAFQVLSARLLEDSYSATRGRLEPALMRRCYEASISEDPALFRRWQGFVAGTGQIADLLDHGTLMAVYSPSEQRGDLLLDRGGRPRLPVHLLGFGIQHFLGVLAGMFLSGAEILVLEEPESSLAAPLHPRLRDTIRQAVVGGYGLSQVFVTSHSSHFDSTGEPFLALERGASGEVVARWRPAEEAGMVVGAQMEGTMLPSRRGVLSYVSADGVVLLPEAVRRQLGLLGHADGVVFHTLPGGGVELLTDTQWSERQDTREGTDAAR